MAALALAGLIVALGVAQEPVPEDRWVVGASPLRTITDPCEPSIEAQEGTSQSWVSVVMIERGHPIDLVCGVREDFDAQTVAAAGVEWWDLTAQAAGRALVVIGSISRPLDADGSWGPESDAGSRALYLHLKADDYRALRELGSEDPAPSSALQ